jgi:glycosyltransferase involved in cell wall biosynthesis
MSERVLVERTGGSQAGGGGQAAGSAARPSSAAWDVSLIGFGLPSDPRTFSGYALNLMRGLSADGHVRREFSAKNVRMTDAFGSALRLDRIFPKPKVSISRRWMWSERGSKILSDRLNAQIEASGDRGAFLEVGTLVRVDPQFGPHYQLTDMTIAQARRAGHFAIGRLTAAEMDEAERVQHAIIHSARHVFVLSDWTAESVSRDCGIPRSRITVVFAGSNLVVPAELTTTVKRVPGQILFVGFDWKRKGGPRLLEAFATVRKALPNATLRVVGCDPFDPESGGGPKVDGVIVEGKLDRRDPAQYERLCRAYLEASCFCLPSEFDPFPNAIIEAMGVGMPAVAFDNGSRREAIVHGECGLLAKPGDVADLAAQLIAVLGDPTRTATMGRAATERVQREFTWRRVVERIGDVVGAS